MSERKLTEDEVQKLKHDYKEYREANYHWREDEKDRLGAPFFILTGERLIHDLELERAENERLRGELVFIKAFAASSLLDEEDIVWSEGKEMRAGDTYRSQLRLCLDYAQAALAKSASGGEEPPHEPPPPQALHM